MPLPDFSKMFSSAGNWMQQNPEQFAIIADTLGRNIAPNNPLAGLGTAFGQSSLANKALAEQREQQKKLIEGIQSALGGGQVRDPMMPAINQPGQQKMSLSPADQDGPTSYTVKAGADGEEIVTTTATQGAKKKGGMVSLQDLFSGPF